MTPLRFDYINHRPTEDIEVVFEEEGGNQWAVSFVATVPHYCESPRIFGDLFVCRLESIDDQSVPVARGSDREAKIIRRLRDWADGDMTPEQQHTLSHGKFPRMTADDGLRRSILWFINVLEERRKRDDLHIQSCT